MKHVLEPGLTHGLASCCPPTTLEQILNTQGPLPVPLPSDHYHPSALSCFGEWFVHPWSRHMAALEHWLQYPWQGYGGSLLSLWWWAYGTFSPQAWKWSIGAAACRRENQADVKPLVAWWCPKPPLRICTCFLGPTSCLGESLPPSSPSGLFLSPLANRRHPPGTRQETRTM